MIGKVLNFDISKGEGIISSDDGNRYQFTNTNWKSLDIHPSQGLEVDFTLEDNNAIDIYSITKENLSHTTVHIQNAQTSTAAVISLIFAIIGVFSTWWILGLPSIIAIISGHIARSNISNSDGSLTGDGLALTGLIVAYLTILVYISVVFIFVGALGAIGSGMNGY